MKIAFVKADLSAMKKDSGITHGSRKSWENSNWDISLCTAIAQNLRGLCK
jgi:hypothetical protein